MKCNYTERISLVNDRYPHHVYQMVAPPQSFQLKTIEDIIQFVEICEQVTLADCLNIVLEAKQCSIPNLHQEMVSNGYLIAQQSIYRYFKQDPKRGRFPPLEFIEEFAQALNLSPSEKQGLLKLWQLAKYLRRYQSSLSRD